MPRLGARALPLLAGLAALPATPWAQPRPTPAELAAQLDAIDLRSGEPAAVKEGDAVVAEALAAYPQDFELLWRAARFEQSLADAARDDGTKRQRAKLAWEYGDRARALRPDDVRGHYFAALGVGFYADAAGLFVALTQGFEGKYNERLDRALALDPAFDEGGPWLAKGRYWFELPWPMRDVEKSRQLLEKAVERFPDNLRARLYLADTLVAAGKRQEARLQLDAIARGIDLEKDPGEREYLRAEAKRLESEVGAKLR